MGVSTISNIVLETCEVIWDILQPIEMSEPTTNDWLDIALGYFEKTQFPNTVGAVSIITDINLLFCLFNVLKNKKY